MTNPSLDSRIVDLVVEWEQRRSAGDSITPEELCRDCPELLETLRARLANLEAANRLMQSTEPPTKQSGGTADSWATTPPQASPATEVVTGTVALQVRYEDLQYHARGGMGEVWQATDADLGRRVALKMIQTRYGDDPRAAQRFLVEAEVTSRLDHPGIAPVHSAGHMPDGRPCYSMRFVQGESLREAIQRFHKRSSADSAAKTEAESVKTAKSVDDFSGLAFRELLQRFIAVCNTIAYAHSRGVIHRDLKPANIMLGKYGETLVVDWGLARSVERDEKAKATAEETLKPSSTDDDSSTRTGLAKGTPAYMSPEQAAGNWDAVHYTTDIYSLGATLYEVLTGRPPFERGSWPEMQQKIQRGEFPRPRQINRGVPAALEAVCLKAMALRPEARYGSAVEVATELEHWLGDEPVSAWRDSLLTSLGRWARKHKPVVNAAAGTLCAAIIGLAAGIYFVNAEKNRTELARLGAERSEERAKTEAATATAVKEFLLRDLLELATARKQAEAGASEVKVNPELKVRDLLLRAAQKIEGKFPDQPLVEAEIRSTLGRTLTEIGLTDLAIAQLVRARDIYTSQLGSDHADTLKSIEHVAHAYFLVGDSNKALPIYEGIVRQYKTRFGLDDPRTLGAMNNVANGYHVAGLYHEALAIYEQTLRTQQATLGPDHPDTLRSMSNLANSYVDVGRNQEALRLREDILRAYRTKFGPDHPDTLLSMHDLAHSYRSLGRIGDAISLFEETLRLMKAALGANHPYTLATMNNLANAYIAANRGEEALQLQHETFQLFKTKLGPEHRDTLMSMHSLARIHAALGHAQAALDYFEETLRLQKAKLGADHPDTLSTMNNLANSCVAVGREQEALLLREQMVPLVKAKLGPDHRETLTSMQNLANAYDANRRPQDAVKLFHEVLGLQKAKLGPDHPDTLLTMNNLANSLMGTDRPSEALTNLREALDIRERRLKADPANNTERCFLAWTRGQIGAAEQLQEHYAAAIVDYAAAVEMLEATDPPGAALKRFFRARLSEYRQQLTLCRKAKEAGESLDFVLQQPEAEVPQLLEIRVRLLLRKGNLRAALESAGKRRQLATDVPDHLYHAARLYAMCAAAANNPDAATESSSAAMALLKQAIARGYKDLANLKNDPGFAWLRPRENFQKLLAELEAKLPPTERIINGLQESSAWPLFWGWPRF